MTMMADISELHSGTGHCAKEQCAGACGACRGDRFKVDPGTVSFPSEAQNSPIRRAVIAGGGEVPSPGFLERVFPSLA
ncbi:hypothetical protein ACDP63_09305 [Paracoccus sp. P2]|uniref:Uncharacterized protein n=1 Tax=Aquamicrobium lusatiense TaxID=89772 RepID=A0A7W9VWV6_9HYPH|nr:hypothetical protein [Aquamicrobium lusatiense]MBB6014538.1 hypothetical protein [Aquamicrobium lusatiense]